MSQSISVICLILTTALTLSPPSHVHAQWTSVPYPLGCPAGFDCVGQQLMPFVGAAASIDCSVGNHFVGYNCERGDGEGFVECPSGYFCPDPVTRTKSPKGYWAHQGSTNAQKCLEGAICPEGTFKQRFITPFIVLIGVFLLIGVAYKVIHRQIRKRVAAKLANLSNPVTNIAIQVKSLRPAGESHLQPKLNLEIEHVCVSVKDANASSNNQHQSPSPSPPNSPASTTSLTNAANAPAGMKTILNDITGRVRGGRLTAIMGPSGSGKTTFLNALLNKVPISSGSIKINHTHTVAEVIKMNVVGYVPQQDVMYDMLTVRDLIEHSAFMRLPNEMPKSIKLQRVAQVMDLLGITHIADSVVGNDLERGVSGGEKKRVSIAMELVADPLILFLDEPTSGLDSSAAMQVCDGLLSIARSAKVVCCVIHQPRWEIFSKFEDVLLLGRGGIPIYFGRVKGLKDFFASLGRIPPPNCNPADFYIDTISDEEGFLQEWKELGLEGMRQKAIDTGKYLKPVNIHLDSSAVGGASSKSLDHDEAASSPNSVSPSIRDRGVSDDIEVDVPTTHVLVQPVSKTLALGATEEEKHEATALHSMSSKGEKSGLQSYTSHTPIVPNQHATFFVQVWHLLYRNLLVDCRQAKYFALDSLLQIIPAVALAINSLAKDTYSLPLPQPVADTCITMIGQRCQDKLILPFFFVGNTFFYTMIIGVASALWSVNTFGRTTATYFRDRIAGQSTEAYFLSKNLYDLVHLLRMTMIFMSIFFFLSGPRGGYGYWFATVCGVFFAAQGVSYFLSIMVPFNRATTIGVVTAIAFSVTSGLLPTLDVVRTWGPLQFFWYVSYNRWAAEAFTILNASGQPTDGRMDHAITAVGYNSANLSLDIGIVFLIGIMWRAIAYVAIKRSKPRTEF